MGSAYSLYVAFSPRHFVCFDKLSRVVPVPAYIDWIAPSIGYTKFMSECWPYLLCNVSQNFMTRFESQTKSTEGAKLKFIHRGGGVMSTYGSNPKGEVLVTAPLLRRTWELIITALLLIHLYQCLCTFEAFLWQWSKLWVNYALIKLLTSQQYCMLVLPALERWQSGAKNNYHVIY